MQHKHTRPAAASCCGASSASSKLGYLPLGSASCFCVHEPYAPGESSCADLNLDAAAAVQPVTGCLCVRTAAYKSSFIVASKSSLDALFNWNHVRHHEGGTTMVVAASSRVVRAFERHNTLHQAVRGFCVKNFDSIRRLRGLDHLGSKATTVFTA